MIAKNLHLRIMESFIQAPDLHRAAASNPAMRGGPFMDYAGATENVRSMVADLKRRAAKPIRIAEAIKELDTTVKAEARGSSLLPLYQRVPAELRGCVELCYDLYNQPRTRLIEALLYKRHYEPSFQSFAVSSVRTDDRPFVLSTPRICDKEELSFRLRFDSPIIDELMSMRSRAGTTDIVERLAEEHLEGSAEHRDLLRSLFTTTPRRVSEDAHYAGSRLRIRYFGHATVMVQSHSVCILMDPVIGYPVEQGIPRFTFADLPETIDYVLLTHAHQDHVMFETMLQIRHRVRNWIVPKNSGGDLQDPSLKLMLTTLGFHNVHELDELEQIALPDGGTITGIPFFGEHGDLHIRSKLAYHVRVSGTTLMFVSDSNNLARELYDDIRSILGPLDILFIGMECTGAPMSWLYGPLFTSPIDRKQDQSRRLNGSDFDSALAVVGSLQPKAVYVYAMGQEPWLKHISSIEYNSDSVPIVESNKLVAECQLRGVKSSRLYGSYQTILS